MYKTLKPGLKFEFDYTVLESKTVPYIFPESEEMSIMPKVFSTGYMIALFEWACIRFINEHIDFPKEMSVGVGVNLSHIAATPPGLTVKVKGELIEVDGRKLNFQIESHDGVDVISTGTHERFIVDADRFAEKAMKKTEQGS
jgi:fluoroacetyl-CoA thioesterase